MRRGLFGGRFRLLSGDVAILHIESLASALSRPVAKWPLRLSWRQHDPLEGTVGMNRIAPIWTLQRTAGAVLKQIPYLAHLGDRRFGISDILTLWVLDSERRRAECRAFQTTDLLGRELSNCILRIGSAKT